MFVLNMKFLCLIWWLVDVCTDANNTEANDSNAARRTKHDRMGLLASCQMSQKTNEQFMTSTIVVYNFYMYLYIFPLKEFNLLILNFKQS